MNFDVQVLDEYTNFKNTYNFDLSKKRQRSQFLQEGKNVNYEVRQGEGEGSSRGTQNKQKKVEDPTPSPVYVPS